LASRYLLKLFTTKGKELVAFLAEENTTELKVAALTFLNALVSAEGHDLGKDKDDMREALIASEILNAVKTFRRSPNLADALELQLDVFEENNDIGDTGPTLVTNPDQVVSQLTEQLKGSKAYDIFIAVLNHLLFIRRVGRPGIIAWDLVDKFIQSTAVAVPKDAANKVEGMLVFHGSCIIFTGKSNLS